MAKSMRTQSFVEDAYAEADTVSAHSRISAHSEALTIWPAGD
jgi:hypothetical protein